MTTLEPTIDPAVDVPGRIAQRRLSEQLVRDFEAKILRLVLRALNRVARAFTDQVLAAGDPIDGSDLQRLKQLWAQQVPQLAADITKVYAAVGNSTLKKLTGGTALGLTRTRQENYLLAATNRLNDVGDDLWHEATQVLAKGVRDGEGYDGLRQMLQQAFAQGGKQLGEARANRIARTEVQTAVNQGGYQAVQQLDAEVRPQLKQWIATLDDRTRPDHAEADGQTVPIDQPFMVGDDLMNAPGDENADPSQTINCRCTVIYVDDPDALDYSNRQYLTPGDVQQMTDTLEDPDVTDEDLADLELVTAALADWSEDDHPRGEHGWFGEGTGGASKSAPLEDEAAAAAIPHLDSLNIDEAAVEAIDGYRGRDFVAVNGQLRGSEDAPEPGSALDAYTNETVMFMDDAFREAPPLAQDVVVMRGVDNADELFGSADATGTSFRDDGFMSATTDAYTANNFSSSPTGAVVNITVPAGNKAINLAGEESEVLLSHGMTMDVTADRTDPSTGMRTIDATMRPQDSDPAPDASVQQPQTAATRTPPVPPPPVDPNRRFTWQSGEIVLDTPRKSRKVTADAMPHHTQGMIALIPTADDQARLAVSGGEPVDDLHVTLFFLGNADQITADLAENLVELCQQVAILVGAPIEADAWSVNLFNPTGEEPCWTLGIGHSDELTALHVSICEGVRDCYLASAEDNQCDGKPAEQHSPWVPHLTITYLGPDDDPTLLDRLVARTGPIMFDRIRLCIGDEEADFALAGATVVAMNPAEQVVAAARQLVADAISPTELTFNTARIRGVTLVDIPAMTSGRISVTGPVDENGFIPWAGPITIEDDGTGDGRLFPAGAFRWENPEDGSLAPICLRWDKEDDGEHAGAVVVGRVKTVERQDGGKIWATGVFDTHAPDGPTAADLTERGTIGGVSVDMDDIPVDSVEVDDGSGDDAELPTILIDGLEDIEASAWTEFNEAPPLPAEWFREPTAEELPADGGPVHVAGGRIWGWVARAGVCHDGITGSCVTPPLKRVDLTTFNRSKVKLSDGTFARAGVFTMATGHDNDGAEVLSQKSLFDNTRTVAGIVTVGVKADGSGMWFAGARAPWLSEWDQRVFASCAPSGHWRKDRGGQWSLRAVLSVPVPGFPTRLVASVVERSNEALVASAATRGEEISMPEPEIDEVDLAQLDFGQLVAAAVCDELERRDANRAALAEMEQIVAAARADLAHDLLADAPAPSSGGGGAEQPIGTTQDDTPYRQSDVQGAAEAIIAAGGGDPTAIMDQLLAQAQAAGDVEKVSLLSDDGFRSAVIDVLNNAAPPAVDGQTMAGRSVPWSKLADWNEDDHPRGFGGKFGEGNGSGGGAPISSAGAPAPIIGSDRHVDRKDGNTASPSAPDLKQAANDYLSTAAGPGGKVDSVKAKELPDGGAQLSVSVTDAQGNTADAVLNFDAVGGTAVNSVDAVISSSQAGDASRTAPELESQVATALQSIADSVGTVSLNSGDIVKDSA